MIEDQSGSHAGRMLNLRLSRHLIDEGLRLESKPIVGIARDYYMPSTEPKGIGIRRAREFGQHGESFLTDPLNVVMNGA